MNNLIKERWHINRYCLFFIILISVFPVWSEGDYEIRVKAKDTYGEESEWSDPLTISMPYSFNTFRFLIEHLINRFPFLEIILTKYI